jgi:hypothetical protein
VYDHAGPRDVIGKSCVEIGVADSTFFDNFSGVHFMNPSKFFVPAAVAATVVAVATLAYAQNTTTSPTPTHPAVQSTPGQPMPADSAATPTTTHPAMQGGQGQPMPADSTTPNQGSTSTTGGMSPAPSVVPADNSSTITERPARSDRG